MTEKVASFVDVPNQGHTQLVMRGPESGVLLKPEESIDLPVHPHMRKSFYGETVSFQKDMREEEGLSNC